MNRRGFFGRILGALAAALASPALEHLSPAPPPLAFDPRAFSLVGNPLEVPRLDVLYGFGTFRQPLGCRIADDTLRPGDTLTFEGDDRRFTVLSPAEAHRHSISQQGARHHAAVERGGFARYVAASAAAEGRA
jgi:hypothetical protein